MGTNDPRMSKIRHMFGQSVGAPYDTNNGYTKQEQFESPPGSPSKNKYRSTWLIELRLVILLGISVFTVLWLYGAIKVYYSKSQGDSHKYDEIGARLGYILQQMNYINSLPDTESEDRDVYAQVAPGNNNVPYVEQQNYIHQTDEYIHTLKSKVHHRGRKSDIERTVHTKVLKFDDFVKPNKQSEVDITENKPVDLLPLEYFNLVYEPGYLKSVDVNSEVARHSREQVAHINEEQENDNRQDDVHDNKNEDMENEENDEEESQRENKTEIEENKVEDTVKQNELGYDETEQDNVNEEYQNEANEMVHEFKKEREFEADNDGNANGVNEAAAGQIYVEHKNIETNHNDNTDVIRQVSNTVDNEPDIQINHKALDEAERKEAKSDWDYEESEEEEEESEKEDDSKSVGDREENILLEGPYANGKLPHLDDNFLSTGRNGNDKQGDNQVLKYDDQITIDDEHYLPEKDNVDSVEAEVVDNIHVSGESNMEQEMNEYDEDVLSSRPIDRDSL